MAGREERADEVGEARDEVAGEFGGVEGLADIGSGLINKFLGAEGFAQKA